MIRIKDVIKYKNVKIINQPVTGGYLNGKYEYSIPTQSVRAIVGQTIENLIFGLADSDKLINIYPDFESGLIYHESVVVYDPNTFSPVYTYILRYCLTDLIDTEDNQKEEIKERKVNFKYLLIKT
jgi:hypothetical protein